MNVSLPEGHVWVIWWTLQDSLVLEFCMISDCWQFVDHVQIHILIDFPHLEHPQYIYIYDYMYIHISICPQISFCVDSIKLKTSSVFRGRASATKWRGFALLQYEPFDVQKSCGNPTEKPKDADDFYLWNPLDVHKI